MPPEPSGFLPTYYPQYEHVLAAVMLFLAMLGMGAQLKIADFLSVFKMPKGFTIGMIVQVIVVPAVAGALIWASAKIPGMSMHAGIAVGIALVAAMPGGSMSNIFTFLGRGNVALSVALTCGATLTCLLTTPGVFGLLARNHLGDVQFSMPYASVIKEIALYLLLPMAIGMVVCAKAPQIKNGFSKWSIRGSLLMVALIVIGSFGAGRLKVTAYGAMGPLWVVIFCVAAQQVSLFACMLSRFSAPDRVTVIIEITIRNTLLGLLLKTSIFTKERMEENPGLQDISDACLFVVLLYGGVAMAAAVPVILYYRKKIPAPEGEETASAPTS